MEVVPSVLEHNCVLYSIIRFLSKYESLPLKNDFECRMVYYNC